jgi:hypothetical protein
MGSEDCKIERNKGIAYQLPLATSEAGLSGGRMNKQGSKREMESRTWFRRKEWRDAEPKFWVFLGIVLGREKD